MAQLVLLVAAAVLQTCITDLDCQLNGYCSPDKTCFCDKGWTGVYCERVHEGDGSLVYPGNEETASWGASVVGPVDGVFHGYFNVVCQAETCAHTEKAMVVHGTADSPNGEFSYKDISIPPEMENVHATYDPATKKYLLYFFDHLKPMPPTNCTGQQDFTVTSKGSNPGRLGVASSSSPSGPWTITHPTINGPTTGGYGINPSPLILKNGTYILAYRYNPTTTGDMTEAIGVASATHYNGPYTVINGNVTGGEYGTGGRAGTAEDPFLYQTPRGFHILFHQYNGSASGPSCDYDSGDCDLPGGHAFSRDLITWHRSPYPAYTTTVFIGGTSVRYDFRERPGFYFEDGVPMYFYSGVESGRKSGPPCRSVSVANVLL